MDNPQSSASGTPTSILSADKAKFRQIDKFIKAASFSSYKKGIQNVATVSCFYSLNIQQNNIKDYIFLNSESASRFIVPVFHKNRIVLFAFFAEDSRVEYYDSLKKDYCEQFHPIKDAVEKFLGFNFNMTNQKVINEMFNDNSNPSLANVHICRIAEALCFNQKIHFHPFDIIEEAKRIYKILDIVSDKKWKGEWICDAPVGQLNNAFDKVSDIQSRSQVRVWSLTTCGNESTVITAVTPNVTQTQREININSIINEVVNRVKKRPAETTVASEDSEDDHREEINTNESGTSEDVSINSGFSQITPLTTIINSYENRYPILTQMLKFYSNLTKFRNDRYKNAEITVAFQNTFNWKHFSALNGFEKESGVKFLKNFPYFSELSHIDRSFLLQRFWSPFWFFERIFDTVDTMDSNSNGNFVMLQDKSIYDLDAIITDGNFEKRNKWEKLVFKFWISLLSMMKEIKPDIIEIVYIFCCILWNSDYLKVALSEAGEEVIRRGRLIVHREMREYYDYDEERWNRIFIIRKMLNLTELSVKEYKKVL